ncbi:MAG: glycosyl hydrolase [Armatimonadota bacterium]
MGRLFKGFLLSVFLLSGIGWGQPSLEGGFRRPPDWAKPWVYWFWLNGNITREGITADLEAMRRVGVGGVLIMEVDQGAPLGPVSFASAEWRELFKHVVSEANRLGLKVNMNNDAGWTGSGGPWVPPELAMQRLTWSEVTVEGPRRVEVHLPQPATNLGFYRDIAVLAFPSPEKPATIPNWDAKAVFREHSQPFWIPAEYPQAEKESIIPSDKVVDLTSKLGGGGKLIWDVPQGRWTVIRFGYTPTGAQNAPSPASGRGLECDKLSKEAVEFHFNSFIGKLIKDVGPLVGKAFVATHIDSWEVGLQNWTPKMREEFRKRRGYDPLPFLPALTGRIVGDRELSERFLWDFRQTISELLLENYSGHMKALANKYGLRLTIEGYTTSLTNEFAYGGTADEPMGEFWSWGKYGAASTCTEMVSAGHTHGKRVIGAEAFTADAGERWLGHPGNIKELADWAFSEGINRFVVHRYALQPWLDRRPGMSMGPWGLHYERTQTWWEQSKAWHEYLSRCQYLLQQGLFVADICILVPEGAPQSLGGQRILAKFTSSGRPFERPGYNFDFCSPDVVYRMRVEKGQIVLPDGMRYSLLVLPRTARMTPQLLRKIGELINAGAVVVGAPPISSPSLQGYPRCDEEVKTLAREIWGSLSPPSRLSERRYGKGRIFWGGRFGPAKDGDLSALMGQAKWIWYPEGNPLQTAPQRVTRYFRREIEVKSAPILSAEIVATADNSFRCWVNGQLAGEGDSWERLYSLDVLSLLKPGKNEILISAYNGGDAPNPAGLVAALAIRYADGSVQYAVTDRSWQASTREDGGERLSAAELGAYGTAPWGDAVSSSVYYDIEDVCELLSTELGVPPDFSYEPKRTPGSIRYIHRTIGGTDVYFVANQDPETADIICAFRVRGRRPELWHPDSGLIEQAAVYDETPTSIRVPLRLGPYESIFVVFPKGSKLEKDRLLAVQLDRKSALDTAWRQERADVGFLRVVRGKGGAVELTTDNAGRYTLIGADGKRKEIDVENVGRQINIDGEWEVRFPTGWGAPEKISLPSLISWTEHPEPGVRYFSGTAVYRKSFEIPKAFYSRNRRYLLDLGEVAVMADVLLNGKHLGTLWKPPFTVDATEAVKPGRNELEVRVTNLWVNRMIGDELLPEDSERNPDGTLRRWPDWLLEGRPSPTGRFTFTSWRLWRRGEALQRSGLLGPVSLKALEVRRVR